MSLDDGLENCNLPAYPLKYPVALAYMETIGKVVACGGYDVISSNTVNECYAFDGHTWTSLPSTLETYCSAPANLIVNNGWFLTGRLYETPDYSQCSNTGSSQIFNGQEWKPGPYHPTSYIYGSCLAKINTTHSMLIRTNEVWELKSRTYIYDWNKEQWTESAPLNKRRQYHGCAVLEDQGVIVAGGTQESSVEVFDLQTESWTTQPDLPFGSYSHNMLLPLENTVITPFFDKIYRRAVDGTWHAVEGVVLWLDPDEDKAVLVPKEFANGCN